MNQVYHSLSPMSPLIIRTVNLFGQVTSSQLRRLHYKTGTSRGQIVRSSRHLKRLAELGLVRRVLGVYSGDAEYVYLPASSTARYPKIHTLDIVELYVRLVENQDVAFDPEPWCHVQVGHMTLKPDCFIDLGHMRYFGEIDEGTEHRPILMEKMRRYISAYEAWPEDTFPLVVFIVHFPDRKRLIDSLIRRQSIPGLFECVLFDEATSQLIHS